MDPGFTDFLAMTHVRSSAGRTLVISNKLKTLSESYVFYKILERVCAGTGTNINQCNAAAYNYDQSYCPRCKRAVKPT